MRNHRTQKTWRAIVVGCCLMGTSMAEDLKKPLIIAHRGDSEKAPENTAAAIQSAVFANADLIEFDVRETSDGALLLFHDGDLKRFTGQKTVFESLGFVEARKLDVGSWFDPEKKTFAEERPPTLEEAIRLCLDGNKKPLIERKSGPASAYVNVIRELKAVPDHAILRVVREIKDGEW